MKWTELATAAGLTTKGERIVVELAVGAGQRKQLVRVDDTAGIEMRIWSVILSAGDMAARFARESADQWVWRTNLGTDLVGLRIDPAGRLVGEAFVPTVGLSAEEFAFLVRRVATISDRWEYQLTGRDEG